MQPLNRRSDIDWIRVIAIGLLLLYHTAISFQSWGIMVGFITTEKPWEPLAVPMAMVNIWRIPLLFFVSGMGIYFSIQNRSWKQLLLERAGRILLPFLFGIVAIVPIHQFLWQRYYHFELSYAPGPGHLWFLGNIFIYVLVLCPLFFYLKNHERAAKWIRRVLSSPWGLLPVIAASVAEALLVKPWPYELYAMTWHGFILGLFAFFFGFCFALGGESFCKMIIKWRWLFCCCAAIMLLTRLVYLRAYAPAYLVAVESDCWIFSVFAFGAKYLNRPGKLLNYLSNAAYPVYIMHMIFLYLGCSLIFPLTIENPLKYLLVLAITLGGCLLAYELVIKRVKIIRPLFGLKNDKN